MSSAEQNPSPVHQVPLLKLLDFSLRLSVVPLGAVSFWLAFSSHQESSIYGKIEFSKFTCLKYMVCTSAISAAYALAAAACSWLWFECLLTKAWAFFISDQIIAYLMLTSGAAVLEVLYLAYNGDQRVSWSEACSFYGNFCSRLKLSLVLHALALCCFFLLSVISAYRAFSIFGPPYAPSKEEGEERN